MLSVSTQTQKGLRAALWCKASTCQKSRRPVICTQCMGLIQWEVKSKGYALRDNGRRQQEPAEPSTGKIPCCYPSVD
uniref:Uncharacterized protein n=1 Tax=Anguilla anguilla TaxID=7936 RepID=A0A0E9PX55_ANGAN